MSDLLTRLRNLVKKASNDPNLPKTPARKMAKKRRIKKRFAKRSKTLAKRRLAKAGLAWVVEWEPPKRRTGGKTFTSRSPKKDRGGQTPPK